jgi:hypothetical protein
MKIHNVVWKCRKCSNKTFHLEERVVINAKSQLELSTLNAIHWKFKSEINASGKKVFLIAIEKNCIVCSCTQKITIQNPSI